MLFNRLVILSIAAALVATPVVPFAATRTSPVELKKKSGTAQRASADSATNGRTTLRLKNFRTKSRLSANGGLVIEAFSAEFGGGRVVGNGRIDTGDKAGAQHMKVQLSNVDLAELASLLELPLKGITPGNVSGIIDASWLGMGYHDVRRSITGNATLRLGSSRFAENDGLTKLASFTGMAGLKELKFHSGSAKLSANAGSVKLESLVLNGNDERLSGRGEVDLAAGRIDTQFDLSVRRGLAEASLQDFIRQAATRTPAGEMVKLPAPLTVTGSLKSPTARVDLQNVDSATAMAVATSWFKKKSAEGRPESGIPAAPAIVQPAESKRGVINALQGFFAN